MEMLYNNRVTICTCASRSFIDKEKVVKVAAFLRQEGYDVVVEPDLCEKVRERTSDLPDVASSTIIACYPRAIRSLFASVGMETSRVLDIRNEGMEAILDSFGFAYEVSPVKWRKRRLFASRYLLFRSRLVSMLGILHWIKNVVRTAVNAMTSACSVFIR